jgi:hypothetical protein
MAGTMAASGPSPDLSTGWPSETRRYVIEEKKEKDFLSVFVCS